LHLMQQDIEKWSLSLFAAFLLAREVVDAKDHRPQQEREGDKMTTLQSALFVGRVAVNFPSWTTLRRVNREDNFASCHVLSWKSCCQGAKVDHIEKTVFVYCFSFRERGHQREGPTRNTRRQEDTFFSLSRLQVLETLWHLLDCFCLAVVLGLPISSAGILKAPFALTIFGNLKILIAVSCFIAHFRSAIPCLTCL